MDDGRDMQTRRGFLRTATAGAAGALLPGRSVARLAAQSRRRVTIGGRPVKIIDAHAHCVIPVTDIVQGSPLAKMGGGAGAMLLGPQRLQVMDEQGVDVQALTINGFWWYAAADRDLADRIVRRTRASPSGWRSTPIDSSRWRPWRCRIPNRPRRSSRTA